VERDPFLRQIDQTTLKSVRFLGFTIIFGFILFAPVDAFFKTQYPLRDFILLRAGAVGAIAVFTALAFTRWALHPVTMRLLGAAIMTAACFTVSYLAYMTGGGNSPYWTMMVLAFFGTTILIRFSLAEAFSIYFVQWLIYNGLMLYSGVDYTRPEFLNSSVAILLAMTVSLVGNWQMRALELSKFKAQQALAVANEELKKSVSELAFKKEQAEVKFLQDKLWFAHDLHDTVGSQLAQMSVLAGKTDPRSTTHLAELAKGTLENVRNFAHVLKGEQRVDDLGSQLWKLEQSFRALGRYQVNYAAEEAPGRVSDLALLHVDRILSEWTANVIRHSGADTVSFGTRSCDTYVRIWFYQNAGGFTWRGEADKGGLRSISQRAQNIGAQASVRRRGKGAYFMLTVKTTNG
jgi:signal transduction histidine kinase